MRKLIPIIIILSLTLVSGVHPASGQEHFLGEKEGQESVNRRVEGDEIPDYYVVMTFFSRGALFYHMGRPELYEEYLMNFGIPPHGPRHEVFTRAILDAEVAIKTPTIRPDLVPTLLGDPAAFHATQARGIEERARELGRVYGHLLRDLEEFGAPIVEFHRVMDDHVRPGMTMMEIGEDNPLAPDSEIVFKTEVTNHVSIFQENNNE